MFDGFVALKLGWVLSLVSGHISKLVYLTSARFI